VTARAEEVRRLVAYTDSAKVTENLWGERWSKLVANVMGNGLSACTGLGSNACVENETIRRFMLRLGSEAIRVGQALGYTLEDVLHLAPETVARAGEGDTAALAAASQNMLAGTKHHAAEQRPSMGQDMVKGRRTEIEFLNGFVVAKGKEVAIATRANQALTDIVQRVERGTLKPDASHITDLRLN
jgi:2-dehydropantoate 2-reductase